MKFTEISDIHGEIDFIKDIPDQKDTILLIPGDIHEVKTFSAYRTIIEILVNKYKEVVMVPGNHEYYKSNVTKVHRKLKELDDEFSTFHFLQDDFRIFEEGDEKVLVLGGTLWTDFENGNPLTKLMAKSMMNDYRYIRHGTPEYYWGRKLIPDDVEFFHYKTKNFIKKCIDEHRVLCDNIKTIVMTHHAPSYQSVSAQYQDSSANAFYCSNMDYYIGDINPNIWIHGHTHTSHDYMIGDTRIICNPRGYGTGNAYENKKFNSTLTFEV
ncbi:Ser/Thr protein phosphatase family protein [Yersinia phage fHe-Yen9-03]|uniref:Ser/Thr protein phosphatase family protein n=1 Tax=Yersinia phage fHe-Yen9-03 TaxID=2052743 RepID=A0A2C9CYL8_9CAUD|nr:Ser/Thr protein phosphatase family protein [Yersinia phage fHe-Yen9-03]